MQQGNDNSAGRRSAHNKTVRSHSAPASTPDTATSTGATRTAPRKGCMYIPYNCSEAGRADGSRGQIPARAAWAASTAPMGAATTCQEVGSMKGLVGGGTEAGGLQAVLAATPGHPPRHLQLRPGRVLCMVQERLSTGSARRRCHMTLACPTPRWERRCTAEPPIPTPAAHKRCRVHWHMRVAWGEQQTRRTSGW